MVASRLDKRFDPVPYAAFTIKRSLVLAVLRVGEPLAGAFFLEEEAAVAVFE
jgi:hypothetical protein